MSQKLTDRTAAADAASGDLVHLVDVSDTTDDPAGTSKKCTVDALFTGDRVITSASVTGVGLTIDKTSNDAGDIFAMVINSDNAGAGAPGGIDLSSMAVDEPVIKAVADAITTAGTVSHQIAIDIGGTTYYLVAHTHGS